jgi:hypothetical protein
MTYQPLDSKIKKAPLIQGAFLMAFFITLMLSIQFINRSHYS